MVPRFTLTLLFVMASLAYSWTVYSNYSSSSECSKFRREERPKLIDKDNKYHLWPGLMSEEDLASGSILYGFNEAFETIWKHQNPADCSKAKYLISRGQRFQGVGSEIHVWGTGLAAAVAMNRVLIMELDDDRSFRIDTEFCKMQKKFNLECYFHPWSKCTLQDALLAQIAHSDAMYVFKDDHVNEATNNIWSTNDDQALLNAVEEYGEQGNWPKISQRLHQKSSVQAWERYYHVLYANRRHSLSYQELNQLGRRRMSGHVYDVVTADGKTLLSTPINSINHVTLLYNEKGEESVKLAFNRDAHDPKLSDVVMALQVGDTERKSVPGIFHPLLRCGPIPEKLWHFWWRAIATTYMMRPNDAVLAQVCISECYYSSFMARQYNFFLFHSFCVNS